MIIRFKTREVTGVSQASSVAAVEIRSADLPDPHVRPRRDIRPLSWHSSGVKSECDARS